MEKSIISEGKTTNEAIEKGLEQLKVSKNMVDIKVLENSEKRSFFSILSPRVVKVQLTIKEEKDHNEHIKKEKKEAELSDKEEKIVIDNISKFMTEFLEKTEENAKFNVKISKSTVYVDIETQEIGFLLGYRGEKLYAFQNILSAVANKGIEQKVRVILDIEGYKAKREKALEELAEKIEKTVIKTRKSVTLEPMQAYERKIIHTKLQNSEKVETRSIGEEPRRRIVVELKRK